MIVDDTQLVQKFETWGAECVPKNDILYHRLWKLEKLNSSKSVARKRDANIANDTEKAKKQKRKTIMQYWSIKTSSIPEQAYSLQQSSFIVSKQLITSQNDIQPARQ